LTLAFSLCLAATVAITVSCEKTGVEDEPEVRDNVMPSIDPIPDPPIGGVYTITSDDTSISGSSAGFSFSIDAGALTLLDFNCYLYDKKEYFVMNSSCNLTLYGDSFIRAYNRAQIYFSDVKLSGVGSITISRSSSSSFTDLMSHISAEDGYTVTVSDVKDEGNGNSFRTWTVDPL
jgi:hypothetical protein